MFMLQISVVPSRSACYRESMFWKIAYKDLMEKSNEVAELKAMILEMRGSNQNTSSASSVPMTLIVDVFHLISIINSMEIVARGRVRNLDPDELVGGEEIGSNWCEVHVLVAINKRERLVRPYGLFITAGDVIGATIAWTCPFTLVVHDED